MRTALSIIHTAHVFFPTATAVLNEPNRAEWDAYRAHGLVRGSIMLRERLKRTYHMGGIVPLGMVIRAFQTRRPLLPAKRS